MFGSDWSYFYLNRLAEEADDSSTKISSRDTHTEQSRMGGERGPAGGKGKYQYSRQQQHHQHHHHQQQQQRYNLRSSNQTITRDKTSPLEANAFEGLDVLVTWLLHDEKTQIHIAFADFKCADFDVVILPLKVNMVGIDVFAEESFGRNYGSFFLGQNTQGDVKSFEKVRDFACKNIVTGILYDFDKIDRNKDLINKLMDKAINGRLKKTSSHVIGIPVQFDGMYDPIEIIYSIMKTRRGGDKKQLHCYLCCKRTDADLKPFMMKVDNVMHQYESPKRFACTAFKDCFPVLGVSVEIEMKGILDTRCECIVAAIGGKFQLDNGRLTKAIASGAGHTLQNEVNKIVQKKTYQHGDIIECNPGSLSQDGIKSILFGQLTKWVAGQNKELANLMSTFVKGCLLRANKKGCKSVAFPALGSGYLSYPGDVIVQSILGGVEKYATTEMNGIVSRVVIACPDAGNNPLYEKFVTEISKLSFNKNKPEQSAGPRNDGMNDMWADHESKENRGPEMNQRLTMDERSPPQSVKADQSSDESINDMSVDAREMIYGDMTADVNPGITEYLEDKNQLENFKTYLTKQFGVQMVGTGDKMALKGPLKNIMDAENFLNEGLFNESMFQETNNDEADFILKDKTKSGKSPKVSNTPHQEAKGNYNTSEQEPRRVCDTPEQGLKGVCDTPEQGLNGVCDTPEQGLNKVNNVAEAYGSKENTCKLQPKTDSRLPFSPADVSVSRHDIANRSLHIFVCKNMFSFETDVKVVTTDVKTKKIMDGSKFMQEVLEIIPECQKAWDSCVNKTTDEIIVIDNLNKQVATCDCVMVVVVPYIASSIRHKTKQEFKQKVKSNTRKILENAVDMKVESITLPILVHTGVDNANDMCLRSMAEVIVEYMHASTSLKHFNVVLESQNNVKILRAEVKDVKRK